MTPQASNCIKTFYGGNPSTIKQLLLNLKPSVLEELKNHFNTSNIDKLSICLSIGK